MAAGSLIFKVGPATAVIASCMISFSFVASLYFWKVLGYKDANRDDTSTIQRRFMSALMTCVCGTCMIRFLARPAVAGEDSNGLTLAELLGFSTPDTVGACFWCLTLTLTLFIGPVVQHCTCVYVGTSKFVSWPGRDYYWVSLRNYVFAPFTEEFVFRVCVIRLLVSASFPVLPVIFLSPFCFALAHAHHYIEHIRRSDKKQAMMQVGFQIFYTSLFGMYANFLLVRTGSTVAVILAHTFCNHQGFPDVSCLMRISHPIYPYRKLIGGVYLCGIFGFGWFMGPLTAGFTSTFTVAS